MTYYTQTQIKLAKKNGTIEQLFEQLVEKYIREKYTVSQELAIQRQRDVKTDEFNTYYTYAEYCKEKARTELGI